MITSVFAAILKKLKDDTTLTGYLGGASHISRAKSLAPAVLPAVTLRDSGESSRQRPCYARHKHRDNDSSVQIDVWVSSDATTFPSTGEDASKIANRIDEILLSVPQVTNTSGWLKNSETPMFEDDTRIFHVSSRYGFKYSLNDS